MVARHGGVTQQPAYFSITACLVMFDFSPWKRCYFFFKKSDHLITPFQEIKTLRLNVKQKQSKGKQEAGSGKWYRPTCFSVSDESSARCPPDECSRGKREGKKRQQRSRRSKVKQLSDQEQSQHTMTKLGMP